MIENNNYHVAIKDLPVNETPELTIKSRPNTSILIFGLIGIALLFTRNWYLIAIAIILLLLVVTNAFILKNKTLLQMYSDYIVVHDVSDNTMCYRIPNDRIASYEMVTQGGHTVFHIHLTTGEQVDVPSGSNTLLQGFKKKMPNKEKIKVWRKEVSDRQEKIKQAKMANKGKH